MSAPHDPAALRYKGAAGQHYHEAKRAVPEAAFNWVSQARASLFEPYVRAEDTVVEIGAGHGWNLAGLNCRRRLGVDLTEALRTGVEKRGIEFLTSTADLATHVADVVICHHMLEHTSHPPDTLKEIHRLLKLEGRLLLAVPYERERRYRLYQKDEPNHHLYSWNVQTLCALVETFGFLVGSAGVRRYGQDRFAARLALRLRLGESGFRLIRALARMIRRQLEVTVVANPTNGI